MKHLKDIELIELCSGQLAEDTRAALQAHLAECEECRARAERFSQPWEALGTWEVDSSTHDITGRVLASLENQTHQGAVIFIHRWKPLLRTAAVIAIAAFAGHLAARLRPAQSMLPPLENSYVSALAIDYSSGLTVAALEQHTIEEVAHE